MCTALAIATNLIRPLPPVVQLKTRKLSVSRTVDFIYHIMQTNKLTYCRLMAA